MTKVERLEQEIKNIEVISSQVFALSKTIEMLTGGVTANKVGDDYYNFQATCVDLGLKVYAKKDQLKFELTKALEEEKNGVRA